MKRVTLVPRDPRSPPEPAAANAWLEGRDDVQRVDVDHFVVAIGSADLTTQAEVFTARPGEPLDAIVVEMATGDIAYGSPLGTELRRFCEELASELDLVVEVGADTKSVEEFFGDEGA